MPRRTDLLDRIQIPTPCDADWDSMVGNEQVRFCGHCSLNVTNLSSMTRSDARRLVRESGGRLCVRLYRRPDGSLLTAPAARLHQITRRASKVAAGAFGAVLTLSAGAAAQTGRLATVSAQDAAARAARADDGAQAGGSASLTGTVLDPNGAVIASASVTLTNKETGKEQTAATDLGGVYRFASLPPGTYSVKVEMWGFVPDEVEGVELQQGVEQRQDATLKVQGPQGQDTSEEVAVLSGVVSIIQPADPLVKAAFADDLKAVKELLASGADANVVDKDADTTALAQAVEHGDAEMVTALLAAGADVNLRDNNRQTALMATGDDTPADIVRALLAAGAKVNVRDKDGDTPLIHAAGSAKEDVLRVLIEAGAKINARNNEGQTALMSLGGDASPDVVRALIRAGADVGLKDKSGGTALIHAAGNVGVETLRVVIEAGAEVNAQDADGQTALMAAASEGLVENVRLLLVYGADSSLKDKDGDTALKLAKDGEQEEVVSLLAAYGAVE